MQKVKFLLRLILAITVMIGPTGGVLAAPGPQSFPPVWGTVQSITVETDPTTGVTTVLVTLTEDGQAFQTVRVSQKTAEKLGLVIPDDDGKPLINTSALGLSIEIKLGAIIPDQGERHPIGDALATFFSERLNIEHDALYDAIMRAHSKGFESSRGFRFGTIARALWLTVKVQGNVEVFEALLLARETGDYSTFSFADGTTPKNWAQFQKAVLDGKKISNLGSVMKNSSNGNGNTEEKNKAPEKNKSEEKDKHSDNEKDKEKTK